MGNKKCLICGESTFNKILCDLHRKEMLEIKKNMKKINTKEINAYYHNLKHSIYKMIDINHIKNNLLKLIALSLIYFECTNDKKMIEKCVFDSQKIMKIKNKYENENTEMLEKIKNGDFNDIDFRKRWEAQYRCEDGHYVRSMAEMIIDNALYLNNVSHSYEKRVRLPKYPNSIILCDFYLFEIDTYIEYWGKYDKKYIDRKYAKRKIYEENNIRVIEIYYNDLKRLDDILLNKIDEIKKGLKRDNG